MNEATDTVTASTETRSLVVREADIPSVATGEEKPKKEKKAPAVGSLRWAASVWRQAAKALDSTGWIQGMAGGPEAGGYCAIGVIGRHLQETAPISAVIRPAAASNLPSNIAGVILDRPCGGVSILNDAPGMTKERVQRYMRAVAWSLEHGGRYPIWVQQLAVTNSAGQVQQ